MTPHDACRDPHSQPKPVSGACAATILPIGSQSIASCSLVQVTKRVLIATALIVAGCIILVSFGNHSSESFTSPELLGFYEKTPYIIYLCLMFTG